MNNKEFKMKKSLSVTEWDLYSDNDNYAGMFVYQDSDKNYFCVEYETDKKGNLITDSVYEYEVRLVGMEDEEYFFPIVEDDDLGVFDHLYILKNDKGAKTID